jgi:hypothetical protein
VYVLEACGMEEIYFKYAFVRTFKKISSTYPINKTIEKKITSAEEVVDGCIIYAHIIENGKKTSIYVDINARPIQKITLGKKIGESFSFPNINLTYLIEKIIIESK